jgi:predicted transcriptional regulator
MKQNVTISMERDLVKRARIIAAHRNTSISGLLSQELQRIVEAAERYEHAKVQALADLESGFHLGGEITATREDLHER